MDPSRSSFPDSEPIRVRTLGPEQNAGPYSQYQFPDQSQRGQPVVPQVPSLSPEDMIILRQCNKESFYRRCLPLMLAGNALAYTWFSRLPEPLTQGRRFAVITGVTVASWIIGKMSYRKICEEKILTSGYNSKLVEALRKKRGLPESELTGDYGGDETVAFDWREDDRQSAIRNDWNRPIGRPHDGHIGDKPFYGDEDLTTESTQKYTSYDSLRQQNRSRAAVAQQPVQRQLDPRLSDPRSQSYDDRKF